MMINIAGKIVVDHEGSHTGPFLSGGSLVISGSIDLTGSGSPAWSTAVLSAHAMT